MKNKLRGKNVVVTMFNETYNCIIGGSRQYENGRRVPTGYVQAEVWRIL